MRKVILLRGADDDKRQEIGNLFVLEQTRVVFRCVTLERGWLNNAQNVSCVPVGVYPLVLEYSPRFDAMLWELKKVPGRSECKFHVSNFWKQLEGCIAPGDMHVDINGDGLPDVRNSRKTLDRFHEALKGLTRTTIEIIELS